jgi:hypothetical protein
MLRFYRAAASVSIAIFLCAFLLLDRAGSAPLLANYYLGTLPTDTDSIRKLAKNDLLILSPEQAIVRKGVTDEIRRLHPDIIMLAYVPSDSYNANWQKYPESALWGDLFVSDKWWLRDSRGNIVSDWPGLKSTNMSQEWTDYLVDYVKKKILPQGVWDGIFLDRVNDGISGTNGGDIDLNRDGQRDDPAWANNEWVSRINYMLTKLNGLQVKYLIINGSSIPSMQQYVNGRMYENYPTPWEKGGSWSGLMSGLEKNRTANRSPKMYVFNANTGNTGKSDNYRRMRFGLTSSLLLNNVYFSFDHGTESHAQIWTYDEYDVNLGDAIGSARSVSGYENYKEDVWRRDYANGLTIVNATAQSQEVDLGGEYEKITGQQDPAVNDGSIMSKVTLGARDGLVMLKTFQTIDNVVFANGNFLQFYGLGGNRARNGFFAYEEDAPGGAKIFKGDLDGDATMEKVVLAGNRMQIFNSRGDLWYKDYPLGANYTGEVRIAIGKLGREKQDSIIITGSKGGKAVLLTYYGAVIKDSLYPLGNQYKSGFYPAIGNLGSGGEIILSALQNQKAKLIFYNANTGKVTKTNVLASSKSVAIAAGDVNGDKTDEIITGQNSGRTNLIKILDKNNKTISSFQTASGFSGAGVNVAAADVNFDGVDEIVVMNLQ